MLTLLALLLSHACEPARIEAAIYASALAWGHDPATFRGLAVVVSGLEANPRRYGTGKRWGAPPHGRRWRICSLMQLRGGMSGAGKPDWQIPPCEILVRSPVLSAWYGAAHLDGWRKACGSKRALGAYNAGKCETDGSFERKVNRAVKAQRGRKMNGQTTTMYGPAPVDPDWKRNSVGTDIDKMPWYSGPIPPIPMMPQSPDYATLRKLLLSLAKKIVETDGSGLRALAETVLELLGEKKDEEAKP